MTASDPTAFDATSGGRRFVDDEAITAEMACVWLMAAHTSNPTTTEPICVGRPAVRSIDHESCSRSVFEIDMRNRRLEVAKSFSFADDVGIVGDAAVEL